MFVIDSTAANPIHPTAVQHNTHSSAVHCAFALSIHPLYFIALQQRKVHLTVTKICVTKTIFWAHFALELFVKSTAIPCNLLWHKHQTCMKNQAQVQEDWIWGFGCKMYPWHHVRGSERNWWNSYVLMFNEFNEDQPNWLLGSATTIQSQMNAFMKLISNTFMS